MATNHESLFAGTNTPHILVGSDPPHQLLRPARTTTPTGGARSTTPTGETSQNHHTNWSGQNHHTNCFDNLRHLQTGNSWTNSVRSKRATVAAKPNPAKTKRHQRESINTSPKELSWVGVKETKGLVAKPRHKKTNKYSPNSRSRWMSSCRRELGRSPLQTEPGRNKANQKQRKSWKRI